MKNDSSSSRATASNSVSPVVRYTPVRQTITALFVASLLTGCAAINSFPDKVKLDIPGNTPDFKNRLYAGVGIGNSHLSPNPPSETLSRGSSGGMGTQLRLGYDVHNMLAVEVDTSVLGQSSLSSDDSDGYLREVKYSAAAASALVYGWGGVQSRSRREGLSAYGRVGFTSLKKSSNIPSLNESGVVPVLGVGAEYGFANGLGMRAEITRFDSDASYVGFSAIYRFGISPTGIGKMIAQAAEPALGAANGAAANNGGYSEKETIVERYAGPGARPGNGAAPHLHYTKGAEPDANYVGSMAERWRPAMRADDRDVDGVLDNIDSCPDTDKHVTVDRYGCGLFDAVLHEVTFKSGSHWLTPRARAQLDLLAETLLAFPEARIQARAHTDSLGAADKNLGLSSRRAEVVVQYLQSRGVNELQLQAVGIGEAQPLDSNKTSEGRRRNRRVDIVTLPDQDAGQLLVAANVESNIVMTVQSGSDVQASSAGMVVSNDEWNSRSKSAIAKAKEADVSVGSATEPGMQAANPHIGGGFVKRRPHKSADALRNSAVKPEGEAIPIVTALPQPGFAPNFPFTGVLTGVNFTRGDTVLAQNAKAALDPLIDALKRNESVKIAVMAHTDSQGGIKANKVLSEKRAQAVVQYLIDGGVDANRLKAEGYGELLPLVQNVTAADRKRNRRIEVRVLPSGN